MRNTRRATAVGTAAVLAATMLPSVSAHAAGRAADDVTADVSAADLSSGLIAYYPLDETSGTTAHDASGNGKDATVEGTATWNAGDGFTFGGGSAGSGNAIKLPNNLVAGKDDVTVDFDVYVDASLTGSWFMYNLGNSATYPNGTGYFFTTGAGGTLRGTLATAGYSTEQSVKKSGALATGTWKHVTYVLDGGTTAAPGSAQLYEDGALVGSSTAITQSPAQIGEPDGTSTRNYLGRSGYPADASFKGKIRDFRVYGRTLDAAEAAALAEDTAEAGADAALSALDLGDLSAVTDDLALPKSAQGATVTWTSSTPTVIATDGTVTRPAAGQPSATVTLTASVTNGTATRTKAFTATVLAAPASSDKVAYDAEHLTVTNLDDVRGNLTLPTDGHYGSAITWASPAADVVSATGEVTRPAYGEDAVDVALTATATLGDDHATRTYTAHVQPLPRTVPTTRYMYSYFTGDSLPGEKIYFAASQGNDALKWSELNDGEPVLTSTLGTKGLRDPFIMRSHDGDTFYLIATDLSIGSGTSWGDSVRTGSKNIEIWESTDLVHWSDQRQVKVSPDTAGNTWAPEAYWDDEIGSYVVFWASSLYDPTDTAHSGSTYHRMMYATTRDFVTFSPAKVWQDSGKSRIDTTVYKEGDTYYRFTKDEASAGGCTDIFQDESTDLLAPVADWTVQDTCIATKAGLVRAEGPSIFKANAGDVNGGGYYLFVDEYGYRKYLPLHSDSLANPDWETPASWSLPSSPRHGTVMNITEGEWDGITGTAASAVTSTTKVTLADTVVEQGDATTATVTVKASDGGQVAGDVVVSAGSWSTTVHLDADDAGKAVVDLPADLPVGAVEVSAAYAGYGVVGASSGKATLSVGAPTVDPDLVVSYPLDETSGTVVHDASGHGLDATLVNGAVPSASGVTLDGTNDYVDLPDDVLQDLTSTTVSIDVKIDASQTTPYFVYGLGNTDSSGVGNGYLFTTGDGYRTAIASGNWTTEQNTTKGSNLARGVWKHLTYTLDAATKTGTLYEDGVKVAQNTGVTLTPGSIGNGSTLANYIGRSVYTADTYLKGQVRDFRIYDRALSSAEVLAQAGNTTAVVGASLDTLKVPAIVDSASSTVTLPVKPGTDLSALAPTLELVPGATVSPANGSVHDFSQPVTYTVTGSDGATQAWTVKALVMNSPVLPGYNADPNIVVFGDTYYIYATTDGVAGWGSTSFTVWSSKNLVDWTDHGVILDLGPDVSWADGHAWAPTITEKDGRYYFYFVADQQIGVAVSDSPTGHFTDALGEPLIHKADFGGAQQIDPAVFTDTDGTTYLFWGNGTARMVPLNEDLISYDASKVTTISGLTDFREGLFVNKRNDTYYLTWSVDDTGSENYHVSYATASSVDGPWTNRGTLLAKDPSQGILGTGHSSIVQVPGTDDWYIAYHRFGIPGGDGTHRETTIDRVTFSPDGLMNPVVPTLTSVAPEVVPDLTKPTVSWVTSPGAADGSAGWFTTSPVSVTATGADETALASTEISVDGGGFVAGSAATSVTASLADGRHLVQARATDAAGNVSDVVSLAVLVDSAAPVSSGTVDADARTVTLRAADGLSGVARVEYRVGATGSWSAYSAPVTVGAAATAVQYRAVDVAGNVEMTNTATVPEAGVVLRDSVTAAVASSSSATYGKSVKVTVKVSGTGGIPSGTVRVTEGKTLVGSAKLVSGRATVSVSSALAVGPHALVVAYSGDKAFAGSSDTVTVKVAKASSSTSVSVSPKAPTHVQRATVTAKVSTAKPSGTVTVTVTHKVAVKQGKATTTVTRTVVSSRVALSSNGTASLRLPQLAKGTYTVKVAYAGSSTATGSSATTTLRITK
ncbi:family 43 glycosylhydrolase [Luteimicrobium subarcticum]|uniref:Glycosyl hydrolase family 43 n=1 Tax=Luteimicrobium subarcticum TaxID=620910 RepID=A0A2M8WVT1_9MICO|nr:family 43 glycosylhydrolase [Luteimicrobium subarcticum]PJI95035.1 glycosyl hydrolase family 43 [Luteimicrobium subarcticum]